MPGRRKGPRERSELLRLELGEPWRRLGGERVEERRRGLPARGVRPREVGEALRRELAQPLRVDAPFEPRGLAERLISDAI